MPNARIEKKHKELDKKWLKENMIKHRTDVEWIYAKDVPYFKNKRNYKKSVKSRLLNASKNGVISKDYVEVKNFDYLVAAFDEWITPNINEILFSDMDNPIDRYFDCREYEMAIWSSRCRRHQGIF